MKDDKISLADIKEYSSKLANLVKKSGYNPEHVLYIERAGLFPGIEIAKVFNCPISGIRAVRRGSNIKSIFKVFLRHLPLKLTTLLLKLELNSNIHKVMQQRNIILSDQLPPNDKSVLIVDDAVDTGLTLKSVVDFLISNGFNRGKLKSAVITTTRKAPVYNPDVSLFSNTIFIFPWSYASKEFHKSWSLYDTIKTMELNKYNHPGAKFNG